MARSALLNVMVGAATKAGRRLAREFGEVENLQVSLKGPSDYVSRADRQAEETIRDELMKARPSYGFLGEEGEEIKAEDGQHRWIVDPLDGTTNFLHSIPLFASSIALERRGTLVAAVVYNPVLDELYTAERGQGAFLNDRRIRVAARRKLADCVIGCGLPHLGRGDHGRFLLQSREVMGRVAGMRRMGAAALDLASVAAGRLDGFWEEGLEPWDIAAGLVLVREAGGFTSDMTGADRALRTGDVVAGNEAIHKQLLAALGRVALTKSATVKPDGAKPDGASGAKVEADAAGT